MATREYFDGVGHRESIRQARIKRAQSGQGAKNRQTFEASVLLGGKKRKQRLKEQGLNFGLPGVI